MVDIPPTTHASLAEVAATPYTARSGWLNLGLGARVQPVPS